MYFEVIRMALYKEILAAILEKEETHLTFPHLKIDATELVELACYSTLQKIKAVIEDDSLEDEECFLKIEEIVSLFEQLGSDGRNRHDFG